MPSLQARAARPHNRRKRSFRLVRKGWRSEDRQFFHQSPQMLRRKNLARKENPAKGGEIALLQLAARLQQCQHHRDGIPHRDPLVLNESGQLHRENRQSLRHERNRRASLGRDKNIEDREIKVERSVVGESVVSGDIESFAAPVDESQCVEMRKHHAFWHARGTGCEKNISEIWSLTGMAGSSSGCCRRSSANVKVGKGNFLPALCRQRGWRSSGTRCEMNHPASDKARDL